MHSQRERAMRVEISGRSFRSCAVRIRPLRLPCVVHKKSIVLFVMHRTFPLNQDCTRTHIVIIGTVFSSASHLLCTASILLQSRSI